MKLAPVLAFTLLGTVTLVGCSAGTDEPGDPGPVNPSVEEPLSMPKCGTVLGSFDGTNAYSNANNTGTGYSCAGGGAYGLQYQCVELVMRHFKTHWGLRWYGNAKDLLAGAPKASVEVYYNGDAQHPPVPGDMIVWTNGTYGHVALVTKVNANSVEILEQNVVGSGKATLSYANGTIGARWGSWVPKGWAHAKANGAQNPNPPPQNPPPQPPPQPTVNWSCSKSAYQGKQIWTCSGSARYRCENGTPVKQDCPNGCKINPLGTDDVCL